MDVRRAIGICNDIVEFCMHIEEGHHEEVELDEDEEHSSSSFGGVEVVVGNLYFCCNSQLLQTVMWGLLSSNLSTNIASNVGSSGVPHFHWRQRV